MPSTRRNALVAAGLSFAIACGDSPTEPLGDPRGLILLATVAFPAEIHVMRPDGSDRRQLTRDEYNDIDPHWSPDGRQIVFARSRQPAPGDNPPFDIDVMDADGRHIHRLLQSEGTASGPRWSPDGRRIAFQRMDLGSGYRIYVMNADGTDVRRVTAAVESVEPDWAPDGERLVFVARRPGRAVQSLYTIRSDGTDERLVAGDAACAGDAYTPRWSPDGTRIVYRCDAVSSGAIHLIRADGTNAVRLTPVPSQPSLVFERDPVWSPDGGQILFFSNRVAGYFAPTVMDTLGGNVAQIGGRDAAGLVPTHWGALPK
jgi:TolB protein